MPEKRNRSLWSGMWAKLVFATLSAGALYWLLDSAYAYYLYVEHYYATNLYESVSFLDTLFLDVPIYSVMNRLTFIAIFFLLCLIGYRSVERSKERERALRESQERLALALEGTGLGLWDWDLVNRRMTTDQRWAEIIGYSKEEFDQNPGLLASIVHPEEWRAAQDAIVAHASGLSRFYEGEYRIRNKAGQWVWIRDRGKVVQRDENGGPVRMTGTHLDITDSKNAEMALKRSEQHFRMLFENCPVSIWEADWSSAKRVIDRLRKRGIRDIGRHLLVNSDDCEKVMAGLRTTMANHISMEIFGADSEDELLVPSAMRRIVGDKGVAPVLAAAIALAGGARQFRSEATLTSLTGEHLDFEGAVVVYPGSEETLNRVLVTLVDITALKKAEERKREMEARVQQVAKFRSLGVMARGIAHDFNNLATAIAGNVELAKEEASGMPSLIEKLADIEAASSNASELCRHMMAYSGEQTFHLVCSDINRILTDVVRALDVTVSRRGNLVCRFSEALPPVAVDSPQIRQIFMNLIMNARDALGEKGGTISIRTSLRRCTSEELREMFLHDRLASGSYVCIDVVDTGCGIESEMVERIFDPFFSTKATGRGLGLASVVGIIRGHHGAIDIRSIVGTGTTMSILLPACEERSLSVEKSDPETEVGPSQKYPGCVLLAEDQAEVRRTVARMLKVLGFDVVVAVDGQEAVTLFKTYVENLVLVLLDFSMPKLDGVKAFEQMREVAPTVPIIIASGYDETVALEELQGQLPADIVQKPLSFEKLRDLITRFAKVKPVV